MAAAWRGLPDSEPESERARVCPATSSGQIRSSPPAWPRGHNDPSLATTWVGVGGKFPKERGCQPPNPPELRFPGQPAKIVCDQYSETQDQEWRRGSQDCSKDGTDCQLRRPSDSVLRVLNCDVSCLGIRCLSPEPCSFLTCGKEHTPFS